MPSECTATSQPRALKNAVTASPTPPAQGTVLDRDHMAELGTDPGQQGLVERFGEAQVVMRHAHALRRGAFRGTGGSVADRPDRHQRHVRTFAEPPSPADGQRLEGNARHRRPAPLPRG